MSEERHYYWLKLQETFFEDDTIDYIESQENGERYVLFYLKLCLKALKNEGKLILYVGEMLMPYDDIGIAKLTKTDVDTVRAAFLLFSKIGLIKVLETGEIYLTQLNELIGSETSAAKRKRMQRLKQKALEEKRDIVTQESHKCHTDIDIEKEIEKDKELDTDINENVQMCEECTNEPQNNKSKKRPYQIYFDLYINLYNELVKNGTIPDKKLDLNYGFATKRLKALLSNPYFTEEKIIQGIKNAVNDHTLISNGFPFEQMLTEANMTRLIRGNYFGKSNNENDSSYRNGYKQVYTDEEYRSWSDDPDTTPF